MTRIFARLNVCVGGAHCRTCRDTGAAGHAWRKSLAKVFALPPGAPDFECPHGRPWGYEGEGMPLVTDEQRREVIARRLMVCFFHCDQFECEPDSLHLYDAAYDPPRKCTLYKPGEPCKFNRRLEDVLGDKGPCGRWPVISLKDDSSELQT